MVAETSSPSLLSKIQCMLEAEKGDLDGAAVHITYYVQEQLDKLKVKKRKLAEQVHLAQKKLKEKDSDAFAVHQATRLLGECITATQALASYSSALTGASTDRCKILEAFVRDPAIATRLGLVFSDPKQF